MDATLPRHRFTADEYQLMGKVGIFMEDDPVELIQGELIVVPPRTPAEGYGSILLNRRLHALLEGRGGDDLLVSVHNPFRLDDYSEPVVDLAIIRFRGFSDALPTADDVALLIELAETQHDYHRDIKFPLYAAGGVREAWLFDLVAQRIERHTEPGRAGYRQIAIAGPGESLTSSVLPTVTLSIDDAFKDHGLD